MTSERAGHFQSKELIIIRTCFALSVTIVSLASATAAAAEHIPYDAKLAAKYDLDIPAIQEDNGPGPEWLQKADMFSGARSVWKGYDIDLKDVAVERIVRYRAGHARKTVREQVPVVIDGKLDGSSVNGVALLSHAPHSPAAYKQAHEQGFRAIPYVHFMCIHTYYADQDVFYFQHPEILLKDSEGRWVHTPMDGSDRLHRILTCANSPSYWKLSLAYVKKMMDFGADGVFIDNVGRRRPCHAHKSTTRNPEFDAYVHEHLFPEATHDYAWDRLLQSIRNLVKSYGDDKIVVLNPGIGTPFHKNGDCCMWESFVYSWAWEGRRHTWEQVKQRAKDNDSYLKSGRRITALSYLDGSRKEVKEDAYWAFSAARLVDFIWWAALDGTKAEALYRAHMGKPLEPIREDAELAHRTFENGLIVLNNSEEDKEVECTLAQGFGHSGLLDLFDGSKTLDIHSGRVTVAVPAKNARVYIVLEAHRRP